MRRQTRAQNWGTAVIWAVVFWPGRSLGRATAFWSSLKAVVLWFRTRFLRWFYINRDLWSSSTACVCDRNLWSFAKFKHWGGSLEGCSMCRRVIKRQPGAFPSSRRWFYTTDHPWGEGELLLTSLCFKEGRWFYDCIWTKHRNSCIQGPPVSLLGRRTTSDCEPLQNLTSRVFQSFEGALT